MVSTASLAEVAALVGDPARAGMLTALMDGRALTATELAQVAGVAPQTASGHLARLSTAGLLSVAKQGRHRYHRLASPEVARMLEGMMEVAAGIAGVPTKRLVVGPRDQAMRLARSCYDHLAGTLGVAITDAMLVRGQIELAEDGGAVTDAGMKFLRDFGVAEALEEASRGHSRRPFCRPCLDWSERRPHLGGLVGKALSDGCFERGWIKRMRGTRAIEITPRGRVGLRDTFDFRPQ
ncbi:MAG TPA: helix-turn-helix transcriptional regulator [Stellaceae bacterium]|nr:helix-turn-helix transcriptional regulator [Stellaceae bacterium]